MVTGACVGAGLGACVSLCFVSLRGVERHQFTLLTLFALMLLMATVGITWHWYRAMTSTYWEVPSPFVRWVAELGG
jgi:hypothetical protein